jgi:hypothetical protein
MLINRRINVFSYKHGTGYRVTGVIVTPPSSEERCRPGVTLNFEEYFRIKMGYSKV